MLVEAWPVDPATIQPYGRLVLDIDGKHDAGKPGRFPPHTTFDPFGQIREGSDDTFCRVVARVAKDCFPARSSGPTPRRSRSSQATPATATSCRFGSRGACARSRGARTWRRTQRRTFARVFGATNFGEAVPLDEDTRRWALYEGSSAHKEDTEYIGRLRESFLDHDAVAFTLFHASNKSFGDDPKRRLAMSCPPPSRPRASAWAR